MAQQSPCYFAVPTGGVRRQAVIFYAALIALLLHCGLFHSPTTPPRRSHYLAANRQPPAFGCEP